MGGVLIYFFCFIVFIRFGGYLNFFFFSMESYLFVGEVLNLIFK